MTIEIEVPPPHAVIAGGCNVPIARRGQRWSAGCLGELSSERGVYVIHHGAAIKYVGKTEKPRMSFGARLRREFTETGSQGKHIYPRLVRLRTPPAIKVYFFGVDDIRTLVSVDTGRLDDAQQIALFETALIQTYRPAFQTPRVGARAEGLP